MCIRDRTLIALHFAGQLQEPNYNLPLQIGIFSGTSILTFVLKYFYVKSQAHRGTDAFFWNPLAEAIFIIIVAVIGLIANLNCL